MTINSGLEGGNFNNNANEGITKKIEVADFFEKYKEYFKAKKDYKKIPENADINSEEGKYRRACSLIVDRFEQQDDAFAEDFYNLNAPIFKLSDDFDWSFEEFKRKGAGPSVGFNHDIKITPEGVLSLKYYPGHEENYYISLKNLDFNEAQEEIQNIENKLNKGLENTTNAKEELNKINK